MAWAAGTPDPLLPGDLLLYMIDTRGRALTAPLCEYAFFSEGVYSVEHDGKWGVLSLSGKEIVPCIYGIMGPWEFGIVKMRRGRTVDVFNSRGKLLRSYELDRIPAGAE